MIHLTLEPAPTTYNAWQTTKLTVRLVTLYMQLFAIIATVRATIRVHCTQRLYTLEQVDARYTRG